MSDSKFLKVAKQAALEAGKIIQKYSGKKHKLILKDGDSSNFATRADLEAEEKIVEILTKNFPDHNIIAEEKTKINKNSNYTWIIDPLDGTVSYVRGLPYVAVLIGLLKDKEPILGVIYQVQTKDLYWAEEGKGAYLNGKLLHVSKNNSLSTGAVGMDLGHRNARVQKFDHYVLPLFKKIGYLYSTGSSIPMGSVAKGTLDAYIAEAWIWDFVAGAVIVKEAGGKVTDFEGNEPDWTKDRLSLILSNGLIHDQILEALK